MNLTRMAFANGFMYMNLNKSCYYPGEVITGAVHLLVNSTIEGIGGIDIEIKGSEHFKYFTNDDNEKNLTNKV